MTPSETIAYNWLLQNGYKPENIKHYSKESPDFICTDGKRYEVKQQVVFTLNQILELKDNDYIIFTDKKEVKSMHTLLDLKDKLKLKISEKSKFEKERIEKGSKGKLICNNRIAKLGNKICGYSWEYAGKSKLYTSCPICHGSVKVSD